MLKYCKKINHIYIYPTKWQWVIPTYPGVPQAVAIIPESSIFDSPKSLIMILLSSSGL